MCQNVVGNEPFAVLFGDDVVDSEIPCLLQILKIYEKYQDPVIALYEVPKEQVSQYGIIKGKYLEDNTYQIFDMVEKPKPKQAPSNLAIVGKYIVTPDIFPALEEATPSVGKEIRLIDGLKKLLGKRPIYGCKFKGIRYDMGNKTEFLKAACTFGLKRPDIAPEFKKFLKELKL
jgi:UTP--glucose-1-phosphate uridylyltransferase